MKKIYLHGSFMNDNFGDYLLFKIVGDWIYESDSQNIVLATNVSTTYDDIAKFKRCDKKDAIKEADLIILGGGGYLGEPNSNKLKWALNFTKNHSMQFIRIIRSKKPYMIVGVGAGTQKYFFTKLITKKICNNAKFISVRDNESRDFLYSIGVKKDINVIPDIVMSVDDKDFKLERSTNQNTIKDKENIIIHLTSRVSIKNKLLVEDIVRYSKENKCRFIICSDQGRDILKERNSFWREKLNGNDVEVYNYKSPYELLKIIEQSDMVITDKLHVGIVATRMYKKVISVAGHSKISRFYNQIGRIKNSKNTEDITLGEVYSMMVNKKLDDDKQVKNISNLAIENKKIVMQFLNEYRNNI